MQQPHYGVGAMGDLLNLITYKVNVDGSLTQISAINGGTQPFGLKISTDGKFAYELTSEHIDTFSINNTTGELTRLTNESIPVPELSTGLTLDKSGKFLYIISLLGNNSLPTSAGDVYKYNRTIAKYQITESGTLIPPTFNTSSSEVVHIKKSAILKSIVIAAPEIDQAVLVEPTVDQLNNVPITATFTIQFPTNINPNSVNDKTIQIIQVQQINKNSIIYESIPTTIEILSNNLIKVIPVTSLPAGSNFTLKEYGVKDQTGESELPLIVNFYTQNVADPGTVLQPNNLNSTLANAILRVEYPYLINSTSVTESNVYVTLKNDEIHISGKVNMYTLNSGDSVINFISDNNYINKSIYSLHIQNLKSNDGSLQNINKIVDFTIESTTADLLIYEATALTKGYSGLLNGLNGADTICNTSSEKPISQCHGSCIFKAMLGLQATNGRYGCIANAGNNQCGDNFNLNWVLMRNQRYVNTLNGLIEITNNDGLLPVTLENYIETSNYVSAPTSPHQVWSGLSQNWNGLDLSNTCNAWMGNSSRDSGVYGIGNTTNLTYLLQRGSGDCNQQRAIYCVELPVQNDANWWDKNIATMSLHEKY